MISSYNSFLEDKLLENAINESIVYFSPELRKILDRLSKDNEIAEELTKIEGENVKPDITFLDIDKDGYLSFITMRNAINMVKDGKYSHIFNDTGMDKTPNISTSDAIWRHDITQGHDDLGIFKKSRNQVKIGKLVNKLLPDKFSDKQIEEFVNSFKARLEKQGERFEVVEGVDIEFWYNSKNYKERSGTLGNSCMASKSNIFQLYTHNPEVCKLVILKEDDQLIGRALLWKLNSVNKSFEKKEEGATQSVGVKPEYFMDRQYTINDSDVVKFKNYAESKGWAYKTSNNHHSYERITFLGESKNVSMTVTLKPYRGTSDYDYNRYPYLDTFRRYDPGTGYLYNDEDDDRDNQGQYLLDDTGGGHREIESGVYSEWFDRTINEDDAVYSDPVNSYLPRDQAVEVRSGSRRSRGWWPEEHEEIVYDNHIDEYLHQDDCYYSEIDREWVYQDNCKSAVVEIDEEGYINGDDEWVHEDSTKVITLKRSQTWYQKLSEIDGNWESKTVILKSLMIKDHNNDWIPKIFSIYQNKVSDPISEYPSDITGIEYLNEVDAIALGYSVERHNPQLIDVFTYTDSIKLLLPEIQKKLRSKVEKLKHELSGKQMSLFGEDKDYKKKLEERLNWYLTRLEQIEEDKWS